MTASDGYSLPLLLMMCRTTPEQMSRVTHAAVAKKCVRSHGHSKHCFGRQAASLKLLQPSNDQSALLNCANPTSAKVILQHEGLAPATFHTSDSCHMLCRSLQPYQGPFSQACSCSWLGSWAACYLQQSAGDRFSISSCSPAVCPESPLDRSRRRLTEDATFPHNDQVDCSKAEEQGSGPRRAAA